uniref:Uncharacterized protein n=1 Tax=Anguilla anguilla TaxID=7936 RepID=A0A0E9TK72_ANGAN
MYAGTMDFDKRCQKKLKFPVIKQYFKRGSGR